MKPAMELTRDALIAALAGRVEPDAIEPGAADKTENRRSGHREPIVQDQRRHENG